MKKRTANKNLYLVVLWTFAARIFIYLFALWAFAVHAVKLMKMFFLVLFQFACVFWSCGALSSLGHRIFHYKLYYQHNNSSKCVNGIAWCQHAVSVALHMLLNLFFLTLWFKLGWCAENNFHLFFNGILFLCCFLIIYELAGKIKTAGWLILFILNDKQDDVNFQNKQHFVNV